MTPFLIEVVSQAVTGIAPLLPYVGASVGVIGAASFAQVVPRIGPVRAGWVAVRSRFLQSRPIQSVRTTELNLLRKDISRKTWGQKYIVVTGEKGVGKSCLIDSAVYKTCGVIRVTAQPGHSQDKIIESALRGLTGLRSSFWDLMSNSKRVVFWYKVFTFGRTPIVVVSVTERKKDDQCAGVAAAVRTLTDDLHLRVIVDSSPNSIDESVTQTNRGRVRCIDSMDRQMIESLPQFSCLIVVATRNLIGNVLWGVLGGNPSKYQKLWDELEMQLDKEPNLPLERQVIGRLLCDEVSAAIDLVRTAKKNHPHMKKTIELFDQEKNQIEDELLEKKGLQQPAVDKVFRKVERNGIYVLIPSSNAVGIVLRYSITRRPSLEELTMLI
ncbi:hypothetical protein BDR26DRAFT_836684 [Obelidium mucronatum]|nr:hypothetical protein BDR26DRAFT_836684 [Obelidium mucronatum]